MGAVNLVRHSTEIFKTCLSMLHNIHILKVVHLKRPIVTGGEGGFIKFMVYHLQI